ncbi:nucleotidyltransferase substrate binding protein [Gracilibacillus phocaeensis]|uniref:nucleotidyltransferase substrate binding protein n=1 Tax=Gracilibacillus phocaeensis TaxID=2042304 RepID=UPI0010324B46|nr:nucleotidyltransferase substrate binding protein [Gracilibacillus phocaeensis]
MERLIERVQMAKKALASLQEIISHHEVTDIIKDAAIQRFEFTFEATWKAAKQYLYDVEGLDIGSPKGVIRSCREVGLFTDLPNEKAHSFRRGMRVRSGTGCQ